MTNFFLDCEFYEDGQTIQLISMAIVSGADDGGSSLLHGGRYLYIEDPSFEWDDVPADHWLHTNVKPHLGTYGTEAKLSGSNIAPAIINFIDEELMRLRSNGNISFWGYYADYDWVLFCQQFGTMLDLPEGFPMYCRDLKQWADQLGAPILPPQSTTVHHALADARWNHEVHTYLHRLHWRDF